MTGRRTSAALIIVLCAVPQPRSPSYGGHRNISRSDSITLHDQPSINLI
jgi:hypothetical protein